MAVREQCKRVEGQPAKTALTCQTEHKWELQLQNLTSNLCILVKGYWQLSRSHHTISGLKLLEIQTCSPSTHYI